MFHGFRRGRGGSLQTSFDGSANQPTNQSNEQPSLFLSDRGSTSTLHGIAQILHSKTAIFAVKIKKKRVPPVKLDKEIDEKGKKAPSSVTGIRGWAASRCTRKNAPDGAFCSAST